MIIDRACGASEYFACHVPDTLAKTWQSQMKHIIGPGIVVARCLWHSRLCGRPCIYFIDNYAAMDACIRGTSGSPVFRELLVCFEKAELLGQCWYWFSRVPSPSNPADEPSRGKLDGFLTDLKASRVSALCRVTGVRLLDL